MGDAARRQVEGNLARAGGDRHAHLWCGGGGVRFEGDIAAAGVDGDPADGGEVAGEADVARAGVGVDRLAEGQALADDVARTGIAVERARALVDADVAAAGVDVDLGGGDPLQMDVAGTGVDLDVALQFVNYR